MIADERTVSFINSLDHGLTPFLEELQKEALAEGVPVIRTETQSLLRTLLALTRPRRILEIGTAVGFSAVLMAQYAPHTCRITTIENYAPRILAARKNLEASGFSDRITLLAGDAAEILPTLEESFDLIFMDAAKGQYIRFLPEVKRLMRPGSLLVSDNVLQDGDLTESHYIVERRNRTIYRRMREYLRALKDDESLETSILPLGDGVSLSVLLTSS